MKNFSKYHFIYLVKETVLSNKLIDGIVTDDSVKIDETVHEEFFVNFIVVVGWTRHDGGFYLNVGSNKFLHTHFRARGVTQASQQ